MVNVFFQATIDYDGFSMVLTPLDHHHWMFLEGPTIGFNGFSMVFEILRAMPTMVCMYHCTRKCVKSICSKMQIHSIIICRTPIHWNLTYSTTEKRPHNLYLSRNAKKCAEYLIMHYALHNLSCRSADPLMTCWCSFVLKSNLPLPVEDAWQFQVRL